MKKKILFTVALAILLAVPLGSAYAVESFVQPSGVLQYNPDKVNGGYVLLSGTGAANTISYLIDMEGYVVHEWKRDYVVSLHETLLDNGNLLAAQAAWSNVPLPPGVNPNVKMRKQTWPIGSTLTAANSLNVGGGHGGYLQEFDWDGNVVWDYELNDATHVQHHTFAPHESIYTPNTSSDGNVLILAWEYKTNEECIAAGRNPATVGRGIWPDYVIEVNRAKQIVWEFHVWDNLVQNFDPSKPNYGQPKDNPSKWDINWINPGMATVGSNTVASTTQDWTHFNTANYHPTDPNKIVLNSRHMGESYIIDKAAKKLIYRFGNPSVYGAGKAPSFQNDGDQLMWGPHHAHIIPPGLPGAGHLLIIDNGWNRPEGNRTRSIEVDMSQTSNTAYGAGVGALPTGNTAVPGTLHPGHIIWQYAGARPNSMYSASQCSNQRLPNGNTFITITETGHIIEVTKGVLSGVNYVNKEVVWEFINPYYSSGSATTGFTYPVVSCIFNDGGVGGSATTLNPTSVHRSTLIPPDHPGLKGKDLSRKYLLATGCPEFWKMLTYPSVGTQAPTTGWDPQSPGPVPILTGFGFGRGTGGSGGSGGGAGAGGAGGGGGGY
jgi:Arylsulfotransferase (ASST)